ncbi:MAG: aminoglycoside phosphotransferase family protein [Pseudomonadales bacterium]
MDLPPDFIQSVHRVFGDEGREWLSRLPELVAQCRARWALRDGVMSPDISMAYIEFTSTEAGEPVALKIGVPDAELRAGIEALRLYAGRRAVRLVDADPEIGAILMQRIQPGTMLWQVGDNRAQTKIAATIMRELPVAVPASRGLPTFARWMERAFRLTRNEWDPEELMPRELLDWAEEAFAEIERNSNGDVVLHGDLHHENILLDGASGWTAIDPKGVIGPRCLEVGRFLQNQLPGTLSAEQRRELVSERLDILSVELECKRETLAAGGLVDCVLSHCWVFEETRGIGPEWHLGIELARTFCDML